jgi:glycosyltransferase involved in cell wall biosynthesis
LTVVNYGVVAARLARAPSVVSVHGLSHFGERSLGAKVWRRMLSYADQRVAVSADIQSKVRACSRSSNLTELIYNSIEAPSSLSENPRDELFAQWDISANAFVVTCVANLREVKGHRYLLQAVALLGQRMPRLKLLLIGTGELHKELEQLARELGVRDRVIFAGRRHDVPNCLAASDLFVLPSLSEGTPLCILEAMRAGLPVVATAVGGIPEIVETGRSAFLVPPGNPQALAEAILAASESAVAASLGACGKQLFHDRFRREIFIDRYAELFVKTAARRRGI